MFRYFTANGTRKYVDILEKLLISYNNTYRRTIKMKPVDVTNENSKKVFRNIYGENSSADLYKKYKKKSKIRIGDAVRKAYLKKFFDKSFYPNWTDNIFKVVGITQSEKPLLTLTEEDGSKIDKRFYPDEIQKIGNPVFRIEKIIKRRSAKGIPEVFVKWLNHSSQYNCWIPVADLVGIDGSK